MLRPELIEKIFREMGLDTEEQRLRLILLAEPRLSEEKREQLFIRIQNTTSSSKETSGA